MEKDLVYSNDESAKFFNELYRPYQTQYSVILHDLLFTPNKRVKTRVGNANSSFCKEIRLDLRKEFPLMEIKQTSFNNVLHELLWLIKGDTNIKYLVDNKCNIWNDDAYRWYNQKYVPLGAPKILKEEFVQRVIDEDDLEVHMERVKPELDGYVYGDLDKVYGYQWRNFDGDFDQLIDVIEVLKKDPDDRRRIVTAHNPNDIANDEVALPSCHNYMQFYSEPMNPNNPSEGRYLSVYFNMRSCDFFLGNPYNVPSYSLLLMMVAQCVGMTPKEVVCNMVDCHLYTEHIEPAKEWINRYDSLWKNRDYHIEMSSNLFTCKSKVVMDTGITNIDDFKVGNFKLENYVHKGKLAAPLLT